MYFLSQFKQPKPEDFDVYVPLARAERHASVVAAHEKGLDMDLADEPDLKAIEAGTDGEKGGSANTLAGLKAEIDADIAASGHDTMYDRKSKVINKAIQDIGMGPYQWKLFGLCGFGWLADNMWLQGVALTLPQLTAEFGPSATQVRYTTCATFIGLCLGASFWGVASDVIGRRLAFNATLFIAGVFGLAVGGGNSWVGTCALYSCLGLGVGGNLYVFIKSFIPLFAVIQKPEDAVDGALFLEFIPFASGNLLTLLSVWWPVGQLISSLIAWGFIANYSCSTDLVSCNLSAPPCCDKAQNMGWRYFNITLGALTFSMFVCRFFFFHLYESPKFLLSRGRQADAVATVYGIAHANNRKTWLSVEVLNEVGGYPENDREVKLSTSEIFKRNLSKFSTQRIGPLFGTKRLGFMTALIWLCWTTIGMGYPLFNAFLPQYLQNAGKDQPQTPTSVVYRNYAITSIIGVPGSIIAAYTVDIRYIGRKGTIASSTLLTGILLFLFTISSKPDFQLAMSSLEAFFQNIMYGVLYAYTPEVFPAPNRGTGTGIASCLNRIAGLCAPIVAVQAGGANPNAPVFASGSLIIVAFLAMCCFPIETRGKQSL